MARRVRLTSRVVRAALGALVVVCSACGGETAPPATTDEARGVDQQPGSGTASGETALPETTNDALPATDQAPTTTLPEEIEASNGASRDDDSGRSSVERQELAVPETPGPGDEQAQFAGPDGQFIDISVGAGYVCGLRVDRSVNCWHDHSDGVRVIPTGEPALTAVSAGWDRTCGLRIDSTVACWWGIGHSTSEVFPGLEGRFVALSVGAGLLCGLQTDSSPHMLGRQPGS